MVPPRSGPVEERPGWDHGALLGNVSRALQPRSHAAAESGLRAAPMRSEANGGCAAPLGERTFHRPARGMPCPPRAFASGPVHWESGRGLMSATVRCRRTATKRTPSRPPTRTPLLRRAGDRALRPLRTGGPGAQRTQRACPPGLLAKTPDSTGAADWMRLAHSDATARNPTE